MKSFCIVCLANYCRSPVAEHILKHRFQGRYEFMSAGISPISKPNMDPRSSQFLSDNDINYDFHTPKKINKKILTYFDKILAVDLYVLSQLNTLYPKYRHKFLLLNLQFKDKNLLDPFKLKIDEYRKIMIDIKYVSENINLEDI